jgi:ribonuclease E
VKRKMLINGLRTEELRVAIEGDGRLEQYQVQQTDTGLQRSNIYIANVVSLQKSLNAAFLDYGSKKDGFLSAKEVVQKAAHIKPRPGASSYHHIDQLLVRNKQLLVQVTNDAVGSKGAALTTNISLAGRYLVLTPFHNTRGISRKIEDESVRKILKERVNGLSMPEGFGCIVRTNAVKQPKSALNRDLNALLRLWKRIKKEAAQKGVPRLIYSDQDLMIQALRDYLDVSINEIWVDTDRLLKRAEAFMKVFMPRTKVKLIAYKERLPLFTKFNLEDEIDIINKREVGLKGGGAIVIDPTEALTAIDVNSGKKHGNTHEETIYQTNLAAVDEVARQLRLRDIGGLIVIDFIDMASRKHIKTIENSMKEAMRLDRARHSISRISLNGLMEINRQRIKQALHVRTHRTCPTCSGTGLLANPEYLGLKLLRHIEARAAKGQLKGVHIALHPELADSIQNKRRVDLVALENEFQISIEIIAATRLHRSEKEIIWKTGDKQEGRTSETKAAIGNVWDLDFQNGKENDKKIVNQKKKTGGFNKANHNNHGQDQTTDKSSESKNEMANKSIQPNEETGKAPQVANESKVSTPKHKHPRNKYHGRTSHKRPSHPTDVKNQPSSSIEAQQNKVDKTEAKKGSTTPKSTSPGKKFDHSALRNQTPGKVDKTKAKQGSTTSKSIKPGKKFDHSSLRNQTPGKVDKTEAKQGTTTSKSIKPGKKFDHSSLRNQAPGKVDNTEVKQGAVAAKPTSGVKKFDHSSPRYKTPAKVEKTEAKQGTTTPNPSTSVKKPTHPSSKKQSAAKVDKTIAKQGTTTPKTTKSVKKPNRPASKKQTAAKVEKPKAKQRLTTPKTTKSVKKPNRPVSKKQTAAKVEKPKAKQGLTTPKTTKSVKKPNRPASKKQTAAKVEKPKAKQGLTTPKTTKSVKKPNPSSSKKKPPHKAATKKATGKKKTPALVKGSSVKATPKTKSAPPKGKPKKPNVKKEVVSKTKSKAKVSEKKTRPVRSKIKDPSKNNKGSDSPK